MAENKPTIAFWHRINGGKSFELSFDTPEGERVPAKAFFAELYKIHENNINDKDYPFPVKAHFNFDEIGDYVMKIVDENCNMQEGARIAFWIGKGPEANEEITFPLTNKQHSLTVIGYQAKRLKETSPSSINERE